MKLDEFGVTGADAKNICYLRDIQDATYLVDVMSECREKGGKAVVIGGGYIGMECAAALHGNRIPVTMVFPEEYCSRKSYLTPCGCYSFFFKIIFDKLTIRAYLI